MPVEKIATLERGGAMMCAWICIAIVPVACMLCTSPFWITCTARMSRAHNDANVLAMGGRIVAFSLADEITAVWLSTPFEGGRHKTRVEQISELENH